MKAKRTRGDLREAGFDIIYSVTEDRSIARDDKPREISTALKIRVVANPITKQRSGRVCEVVAAN